jgi:hypothetical protein
MVSGAYFRPRHCYNYQQTTSTTRRSNSIDDLYRPMEDSPLMSLAPTYSTVRSRPSLRARIDERKHGITYIPTGVSGITKPVTQSYTERYRGTEFEMHVRRVVVSEPLISRGRTAWLVAATAVSVVVGVWLAAAPA